MDRLDEARADLEGLTADLTKFEEMVRTRTQEEAELRRQVKQGKAKLDQLVEARYRREGAESLLVEHRAETEAAQAEVTSLEAQIDRAEKQARIDGLRAKKAELASEWQGKAVEAGRTIVQALDDLYDLEREVCLAARAVNEAVQASGKQADWAAPNFNLVPLLLTELPQARHLGGGAISFQANPVYRVTLEPGNMPWRA
jgi:predicted RNase H-like nuclease (RuvC/YqgF family)